MASTPQPQPTTLDQVVKIVNLVSVLEPPVLAALLALIQKMEGKTTEEILAEADQNWAQIGAEARKQLGL